MSKPSYPQNYKQRQALIAQALIQQPGLENLSDAQLRTGLAKFIGKVFEGQAFSLERKKLLTDELFHTMRGLDILDRLLEDPEISEIMVNGPKNIFIEKAGRIQPIALTFDDEDHLLRVINRCFGRANRNINEQRPLAGLHFPDGSRLQAVIPPASPDGPALSLRRFNNFTPTFQELVRLDSLTPQAANYLKQAVRDRQNIFVCGGTGSGKTSFLNALSAAIPRQSRVITIEDTVELNLRTVDNLLRLEAREAAPDGRGEISLETLITTALRLRPDRIIVGEVRGREAYPMIEAMRTGHPGSMSSGHANSPEDMLDRLALLLLLRLDLPWQAVQRMLYQAIDLLVHLERLASGKRQVHSIVRPVWTETDRPALHVLFRRNAKGILVQQETLKKLCATPPAALPSALRKEV